MLYAITGMEGIFPNSRNLDEYWNNIVQARVSPVSSLEKIWGISREQYMAPNNDDKSWIYNDRGYCLPEDESLPKDSGRQVMVAKKILKKLAEKVNSETPDFKFSKTGLVLGTSWTDVDYFNQDVELLLGKQENETRGSILTSDKQVNDIAASIGIGGPYFSVDTACASSIYALDNGIGLINKGLAESVIVMGLNISIPYYLYVGFSKLKALASDDQILPFSKDASGIILGEGGGAVLIEPLDKAEKSGRPIFAVIKSLGLSADGEERSPFAPGYRGQISALTRAYQHLEGETIHYVEAHGTATKIGDETELKALHDFMDGFQQGTRLPIGSVKSLIGHGLAAAGIAAIIKAVLMINKRIIPPHVEVQPHELLSSSCLYLPSETEELPQDVEINIGVSSFGFGGANSHVVISSYHPTESSAAVHVSNNTSSHGNLLQEPIAILDFGSDRAQHYLSSSRNVKPNSFPLERFYFTDGINNWSDQKIEGDFFPDLYTIDAHGLKTGPNSLKKIDPFMAVTLHTLNILLSQQNHIKNSEDTAVVLGSNMSGTMSLRQYRKCYFLFHPNERMGMSDEVNRFAEQDISFEEITSTIPAMLSGYPARSFNIQGLHQTMSGGTATFLHMLFMAPYWLDQRCKNLVLGAGHLIKSPADLIAYKQRYGNLPSLREGFSAFILQKLSDVRRSNGKILGYISAIVPGASASTFEEACQAADVNPASVGHMEICELNPTSLYMGEAAGTDELLRLICADSKLSCLQFVENDKLLASVFYVKENNCVDKTYQVQIPTEISFNNRTKLKVNRFTAAAAETEEEIQENIIPYSQEWNLNSAASVHDQIASMALNYFEHQRKLVGIFAQSRHGSLLEESRVSLTKQIEQAFKSKYINPRNIVINNVHYSDGEQLCEGELIVDQSHSYFFDHPLDHVPGFLILEGMLQLGKIHAMHTFSTLNIDDYYVNMLKVDFKQYCELDKPTTIRTKLGIGDLNQTLKLTCEVIQNGSIICTAAMGMERFKSLLVLEPSSRSNQIFAEQKDVHKTHKSNIVVERLEHDSAAGRAVCASILPTDDHVLIDGGGRAASVLYLLEVTRQFLSQISHTFGVPFDLHRILLSIDIRVQQALDKRSPVSISYEKQNTIRLNNIYLSNLKTTISCNSQIISNTMYKTQAVNEEIYKKLRWKNN
ncbi:beta-ketoacyl synthase N-terminal-like domain-containing protein [Paenibacillus sp. AN1007]|uniref:Beta-ketoacyl synthase N-terminal-like domain-containing protein n=1 Tax=Paenibacillus sp. AN1007 TaxID=3151385 RepID=A0AAU8NH04_9BACL